MSEEGYVYVLYNPMYDRYGEIYKIGQAKNINDRLKSYATFYPEESEIKYSIKHKYYKEIEKVVHLTLREHRMSNNREFFKCSLDIIKETIDKVKEYTLEEISNTLNKGVGVILNGYKKEEVKEPIDLSRENIIKVFKENDKELYTLFFNNETRSVKAIVKIFIDKFCTNKDGKLLIECIDKSTHKYKYTDVHNKRIITTSTAIWSLINSSCDIKHIIRCVVDKEYCKKSDEELENGIIDGDSRVFRERRTNYIKEEFKGIKIKFKHIMLEYF